MMWIVGGLYCLVIWLVFAKLKLMKLSLPIAITLASVGPTLILVFLFCAQYYHPYSSRALVLSKTVPIALQVQQAVRVTKVSVEPNAPLKKGAVLFELDKAPLTRAVERLTSALDETQQSVKVAEAGVDTAKAKVARAEADLKFMTTERDRNARLIKTQAISQEEFDQTLTRYEQAASALAVANAASSEAVLGVALAKSRVRQAEASLADARYDLDQAVVMAPADGYVTNLQLTPGMLVGGSAGAPVMAFIEDPGVDAARVVVAEFGQKNFLLIKPDDYAEVAFDAYPGTIFKGRVLNAIDMSGAGQLTASGDLPEELDSATPKTFAVRIQLDSAEGVRIPGGAHARAAVYTDNVAIAGIPVMFLMRANSWLDYVW